MPPPRSPRKSALALPEGVVPYRRTPSFDEYSVPKKLTEKHSLKEGTLGVLHVEEGSLRFVDHETASSEVIEAGNARVIEPKIEHHVEILGPVRFYVEFHRRTES